MRFGVLGPLTVVTTGGRPVAVPGAKVRALLADLLLHRGTVVSVDRLVSDLWGADAPRKPAAVLQAKVSQLRRALDEAEPGARRLVEYREPGYVLHADDVDADRFVERLERARRRPDPVDDWTAALSLWRGDVLPEFVDDAFARAERLRLDQLRLEARTGLLAARAASGEDAALLPELEDLLERHPLNEKLRGLHMLALYRTGRQSDAIDSYHRLRDRLSDQTGVEPGRELAELYRAVLRQDSVLDKAGPRSNLPAALSDLIGRDDDIAAVAELLDRHRLVTLTGTGGVGKTRLAIATASQSAEVDGVWLVELAAAAVDEPVDRLAELVSRSLEIGGSAVSSATTHLIAALRDESVLLVLDNCEHLITSAAQLAETLLAALPRLRILATSREPLRVAGEALWPVAPLPVPDPEYTDLPELEQSGAVRLLVSRIAAAMPGFTLDGDNADAVVSVCRQLDGLPLALELAATRVRVLGVNELAARLADRFRLLGSGHRGAPPRQQTLRALVDWSWELLPESHAVVLRRLSVHSGGFTVEAAEEVCADEVVESCEVLEILAGLVDRSLVHPVIGRGERRRYRLLETIAAYGRERLEAAGETDRLKRRHADHYAAWVESMASGLRDERQTATLRDLAEDGANLRAALDWALENDTALARRLADSLAWSWYLRGHRSKARRYMAGVLESGDEGTAAIHVWYAMFSLLEGRGSDIAKTVNRVLQQVIGTGLVPWAQLMLSIGLGGKAIEIGEELTDAALTAYAGTEDQWGRAAALMIRARQRMIRGRLVDAKSDADDAARLFAALGDRWGQARSCDALGMIAQFNGRYDRSRGFHRVALRHAEEAGLDETVTTQWGRLGRLALLDGDFDTADDHHRRGMRLARARYDHANVAYMEGGLGLSARMRGDLDRAEVHFQRVSDWDYSIGHTQGVAFVWAQLGYVAEQRGDAAEAWRRHRESLLAARELADPRAIAAALEGLAGAAAVSREHDRAARLLGAADAARRAVGVPLPAAERHDVDRVAGVVLEHLPAADYEAAYRSGAEAELDSLVDELLKGP